MVHASHFDPAGSSSVRAEILAAQGVEQAGKKDKAEGAEASGEEPEAEQAPE